MMKKAIFISALISVASWCNAADSTPARLSYDMCSSINADITDPYSDSEINNCSGLKWDEYGISMCLLKDGKNYSAGQKYQFGTAIKLSNGAPNLIELPEGTSVTSIQFHGYCNVEDESSWISSVATLVNGTFTEIYSDPEGSKGKLPDIEGFSTPSEINELPIITINFDTPVSDKIWFKNGGKQMACFISLHGDFDQLKEPVVPDIPLNPSIITENTNTHIIDYVPEDYQIVRAKSIEMQYGNGADWQYYRDIHPFEYAGISWDNYAYGNNTPKISSGSKDIPISGVFYKFTPQSDGALYLPVVLWEGKPLFVVTNNNENLVPDKVYVSDPNNIMRQWTYYTGTDENTGQPIEGWSVSYENHMNPNIVRFYVEAGKEYYVYAKSSRLRVCGFIFNPDKNLELPIDPDDSVPTSIDLSIELKAGTYHQFGAFTNPVVSDVTWETDNHNIASVDNTGLVYAVSEGETTLTANTVNELHASIHIKVVSNPIPDVVLVESINLSPEFISDTTGSEIQLNASVSPYNANDKSIVWSSDNHEVATVSTSGLVTITGTGTTIIKAIATDGSGVIGMSTITGIEISELKTIAEEFTGENVYTLDGILILRSANAEQISGLPTGIYIIGNRKIVVY